MPPPPGLHESAVLEEVQTPPEGPFTSTDLKWTKSSRAGHGHHVEVEVAHIPSDRVEDFIAGESAKVEGGTRFNKAALRRHEMGSLMEPRAGSYTTFTRFMCAYGPEDWRINTPTPRPPPPPLEPGKKGRRKRVDNGESVKRGCLCSFGLKRLYVAPIITEIVFYRKEHTDARGIPCHDVPRIWQLSEEQVKVFKNLTFFRNKIANATDRSAVTNELLFRIAEKMPDSVPKLLDLLTEQEKESAVGVHAAAVLDVVLNSHDVSLAGGQATKEPPLPPDMAGLESPAEEPASPDDPFLVASKMVFTDNAIREASSLLLSRTREKYTPRRAGTKRPHEVIELDDDEDGEGDPSAEGPAPRGREFELLQSRFNNIMPSPPRWHPNGGGLPLEGVDPADQRQSKRQQFFPPGGGPPSSPFGGPFPPEFHAPLVEPAAAQPMAYQPTIQIGATQVPLVPYQVMLNPMIFTPLAARLPCPPVPNFQYLDTSTSKPLLPPVPALTPPFQFCPPQPQPPAPLATAGAPVFPNPPPPPPPLPQKRKRGRPKRDMALEPEPELEPGIASEALPPLKPQISVLDALSTYNIKPSVRPRPQTSVLDALDALYVSNIKPCLRTGEPSVFLMPYSMCMATSPPPQPVPASAMAGWRQHMKDPTLLVPVVVPAGYQPVYIPPGALPKGAAEALAMPVPVTAPALTPTVVHTSDPGPARAPRLPHGGDNFLCFMGPGS